MNTNQPSQNTDFQCDYPYDNYGGHQFKFDNYNYRPDSQNYKQITHKQSKQSNEQPKKKEQNENKKMLIKSNKDNQQKQYLEQQPKQGQKMEKLPTGNKVEQQKTEQKVQKKDVKQENIEVPEEPKQLVLDPKLGYWTYTQKEYEEFHKQVKEYEIKKAEYDERIKGQRMLEQRKRMEKFSTLMEKKQKRNNLLGMKKINQLIRELRIQYKQYVRREKKKQFGYVLDENNNVQIVQQEIKKKKLSKIQKAKQLWDNLNDPDYETVDEDQIKDDDQQLITILNQLSNINPYSKEKYNNMKIRPWITQIPCKELDDMALQFINELSYMQAKKKVIEPKKNKKRIVAGIKECLRSIQYTLPEKSAKLIIIPIGIQECPIKNGPDHQILKVLKECFNKNIPVIFASTRSKLGRAFSGKFGPKISVISVINYQNMEEQFTKLIQLSDDQKKQFRMLYGDVNLLQYINQL
ncbi:unnamed protein product (macronuclear) [Paramecium tetraurelia]|uniref:Uncharacterized protein n=1 Tax=Paramecium tetraurelia TaxID=5888 RepID=A0BKM1_PARTE|nr:uncharacterized protein GSPATT00029719001 [Paramecium tetraurelia]CAK59088.1 unnamed protein product [Paramecium tetraurelia]|eukprot:XP_001426486.1 hypothetical protein (macronuclear) [Paramecium tetraurelia strain d4-2]